MYLLDKRVSTQPFTPEEEQLWATASRNIAPLRALEEQTSLFRIQPEEKARIFAQANQIMSDYTGIPLPVLLDMRRNNIRVEDVVGPLPPDIYKAINALEGYAGNATGKT